MKTGMSFNDQIQNGNFIVTAEYLPRPETDGAAIKRALGALQEVPSAINVSDNPFGVALSSLAASVLLVQSGIEPILHVVTRDRNRIALQSDLLGAASLGIRNVLCLSGYHQSLTDSVESANVYDIDSTQLIAMVNAMKKSGSLLNGAKIDGVFSMMTGAAANPGLKPLELNMVRLSQKVESGADFIQTQAVFDTGEFSQWLSAAMREGHGDATAILAGVLPLECADEAERLRNRYTEFCIPDTVVERLRSAGDEKAQKKEGLTIAAETINALKNMKGVRGIHLLTGGREEIIPKLLAESGLSGV